MTIEQTVEIPASRMVQFSPEVPVGRFRIVFFPAARAEEAAAKAAPPEELPKVTRAEIAAARQDPVIQELDKLPVEPDWSWLPEGMKWENFTNQDLTMLRIKEKYGV
ncbi:hypothetical protein AGMMS50255_3200 [Spirochaetia bacterium]|nr:hypothetical protein AGMMS50255_3200 [Spirochaetia bacterium]